MENPSETLPEDVAVSSPSLGDFCSQDLRGELEFLRQSHHALLSDSSAMEETFDLLRRERDVAVAQIACLIMVVGEISMEKDSVLDRVREIDSSAIEKEDEFTARIKGLEEEVEIFRERIKELEIVREQSSDFLSKFLNLVRSVKASLCRIIDNVDGEKNLNGVKESDSTGSESELSEELRMIMMLSAEAEEKVNEYREMTKKEKRELENSVVSLTEENRDMNNLLRVALLEKEAVEKRLKGNSEHKRVALLQMAERGLQRVGFGFMMGSAHTEQSSEISGTKLEAPLGCKSDSSECEEEVVSLASTVERIMKNLRIEITQLRRSLEESRSDTERLQSLTEKQARDIAENTLYIKELEGRERVLTQNVEELEIDIKETEAEVARWREACELEVEAAKVEIGERDKVVVILKQELERTKAALEISNNKVKLKDELAAAAMAAQAAAEKSLELADSRAVGLRERIEELSRQLEEAESQTRSGRRVRGLCWPWRALKENATNNVRRMLPEMQALLHSV